MTQYSGSTSWCTRPLLWLLLGLAAIGWTPMAIAAPNCTASSATLSLPSSVSIQPDAPVGPLPGTTGTATIIFSCSGLPASSSTADHTATIQAGQTLAPRDATNNAAGPGITFATNLSGIALLVNATPVPTSSQSCLACGPTSTAGYVPGSVVAPSGAAIGSYSGTVTANYTAQLVKTKTGATSPGTISAISLIPFWWYVPGGSVDSTSLTLNASLNLAAITVTVPACTVSTASANLAVTLPTVSASTLSASGLVAGRTPFSIAVTGCPSGVTVATSTFSAGNIDNTTGYLKNSIKSKNGGATNVEVQLLNGAGSSATGGITLNTKAASQVNSGQFNIIGGAVTLNYYAQYIAIGKATAGSVNSSVQFTLTYQ